VVTLIVLGFDSGFWGIDTVRTPFLYSALMFSRFAESGNVKDRENVP
jgi:hypothetical protein